MRYIITYQAKFPNWPDITYQSDVPTWKLANQIAGELQHEGYKNISIKRI